MARQTIVRAIFVASGLLLGLGPLLGLGLASPASAQGVVKGKFGDWEMRCETPPGAAREQCALMQSVAADDKPNVNLVVIVLKTADGKSAFARHRAARRAAAVRTRP